jgi:DNA-binding NtrC family response regulator
LVILYFSDNIPTHMAFLVLLASDIGTRDAWRRQLEARRHAVIVASTAQAAVARLREGGVDIVVVDYEVIGGIGVLMAGLERLPDAPPIVLLASAVDAPAVSAKLGAAAFVPKPCTLEELASVVDRVAPAA